MRKAGEYGAVIESIDAELGRDMFERFGRSPFGARPFEYALDSILGRQIPRYRRRQREALRGERHARQACFYGDGGGECDSWYITQSSFLPI